MMREPHRQIRGQAGTLSWYFDGSDVGLTTDNETVDAIALAPDGRLVVSTLGPFNVPGSAGAVRGRDEDLIVFNGLSFGEDTSGT